MFMATCSADRRLSTADSALSWPSADSSPAEPLRVGYQTDGTRSRARPRAGGRSCAAGSRLDSRPHPSQEHHLVPVRPKVHLLPDLVDDRRTLAGQEAQEPQASLLKGASRHQRITRSP